MDIEEAILSRRSVRKFQPKPVTPDILIHLVDLARLHASAGNLQPLKYAAVTEPGLCKSIFRNLHWAAYLPDFKIADSEQPAAYILILSDGGIGKDRGYDVGAASTTIMLSAPGYGLATCPLGSAQGSDILDALNLKGNLHLELVVALGYPAQNNRQVPYKGTVRYATDPDGNFLVPKYPLKDVLVYPVIKG